MRGSIALLSLLVAAAGPAMAKSEAQIQSFFEGKSVVVKMEMPGSDDGVDVYPGRPQPVDFSRHAARLKQFGTSIKRGDAVLTTKVKVKKDLIEFHLGGGGYGTLFDDASSDVSVPSAPKTVREKNLEKDIKNTTDPAQLRKLKEELDDLKKEREREDARNRAAAEQASQVKEANIRQRRLEGGSRFNIRYKPVVPSEAMTPEGVMQALAEYVDFSLIGSPIKVNAAVSQQPDKPAPSTGQPDQLRKGLTVDQVDALLGRPESIDQRAEGKLKVSTSVYRSNGRLVSAEFVEGVLIRFTIQSQ